ncbi:hypothetical protein EGR_09141 [Echinococcus granulosus]|uniref:Uncharacterized protein n=1 Tax=Echinococcus granulosus TaxID=6210 RepID=W6U6P2_ECHGR|nr:hypothetical protein EGR_09141 [Echinococcus granulosus]EUB56016.1 hypothetical protein EGR_09141 [Echinococcus granulosus]
MSIDKDIATRFPVWHQLTTHVAEAELASLHHAFSKPDDVTVNETLQATVMETRQSGVQQLQLQLRHTSVAILTVWLTLCGGWDDPRRRIRDVFEAGYRSDDHSYLVP